MRQQLVLHPSTMAELFKPVVAGIVAKVKAMTEAVEAKGIHVNSVYLVGGFGKSDMLQYAIHTPLPL